MNLLFVGNSLTFYHDMPQLLLSMQAARGTSIYVRQLTRAWHHLSQYLYRHCEAGDRFQFDLHDKKWDHIILQEHSIAPVETPQLFHGAVQTLTHSIRQAGAQPVLFQTWNYQVNSPKLERTGMTAAQMHTSLHLAYDTAAQAANALLVPVGDAFFLAASRCREINLYEHDGLHPSLAGSYLIAATFECALFHETAPSPYFPDSMTLYEAETLWRIAYDTVQSSFFSASST